MKPRFVSPPANLYSSGQYYGRFATYSQYNYLRPGIIARLKRRRFEVALSLAGEYLGQGAIDFGCADGIFLPSLSMHFSSVVGIEARPESCALAASVASALKLANTRVVCNADLSMEQLRQEIAGGYRILFLLEVLEQVGRSPATMYQDKITFLQDLFSLLSSGGVIIASVARMTGPLFVAKIAIQKVTGMDVERMSLREVLAAGIGRTASVEPRWQNGHLGFNENLLLSHLRKHFIVKPHPTLTSIFYVISSR